MFIDFQSAYDGKQRGRKEHTLRLFEDRVLKKIFGPKRDEVQGMGKDCKTRSFLFCTP